LYIRIFVVDFADLFLYFSGEKRISKKLFLYDLLYNMFWISFNSCSGVYFSSIFSHDGFMMNLFVFIILKIVVCIRQNHHHGFIWKVYAL